MNDHGDFDRRADPQPAESLDESIASQRIIARVLRNILIASVLLVGPVFWFYRGAGSIGFVFGAAVSYFNFLTLRRGVEGLADRIVNRNSREKGGRIILQFLVRYALVAVVAYAIFKGSYVAFRGFLWGLCVPVPALMAEAFREGYVAFRRG